MTGRFAAIANDALDALVAAAPLCWIVPHASPEAAILMPVVLERDAAGGPAGLLGHFPLRAPVLQALAQDRRASCLFLGPNGYISPAMAGRRDWAPTWNFVSARLTGEIEVDPALTRRSVEAIVARLDGPAGWRIEELGARADRLLARIVGFRMAVAEATPRFKLGQDERPETRAAIAAALAGTPLGEWMAAE